MQPSHLWLMRNRLKAHWYTFATPLLSWWCSVNIIVDMDGVSLHLQPTLRLWLGSCLCLYWNYILNRRNLWCPSSSRPKWSLYNRNLESPLVMVIRPKQQLFHLSKCCDFLTTALSSAIKNPACLDWGQFIPLNSLDSFLAFANFFIIHWDYTENNSLHQSRCECRYISSKF